MLERIKTILYPVSKENKKTVQTLASRTGNVFAKMGYDYEDEAREDLLVVSEHTMGTYQRMITLWQQVRYLDRMNIEGALVECGTWRGGACGMMALAHMRNGVPSRILHLFDSFEGLPEPDSEKDGVKSIEYASGNALGNLRSIGKCVGTLEENKQLLTEIVKYPHNNIIYHKGWFQDTVPRDAEELGSIALLRLDGDWYDSTMICLEKLYPLVVPGGIIVIDDYGHWEGCKKAVDEYFEKIGQKYFLNHIDATGRYLIKK